MSKQTLLHVREYHRDYQVKNPKSFAKDHVSYLKQLKRTRVAIEGEEVRERSVKVKQVTNTTFDWDEEANMWAFSCDVILNLLD